MWVDLGFHSESFYGSSIPVFEMAQYPSVYLAEYSGVGLVSPVLCFSEVGFGPG